MRLFWTENVSWFAEVWILDAALYTEHSFDVHLYKAKVEYRPMRDEINRAWTNQNRIPESEERRLSKYLHSVVWSNSSRHQPWWSCYVREMLDRKFILSDWLSVWSAQEALLTSCVWCGWDTGSSEAPVCAGVMCDICAMYHTLLYLVLRNNPVTTDQGELRHQTLWWR